MIFHYGCIKLVNMSDLKSKVSTSMGQRPKVTLTVCRSGRPMEDLQLLPGRIRLPRWSILQNPLRFFNQKDPETLLSASRYLGASLPSTCFSFHPVFLMFPYEELDNLKLQNGPSQTSCSRSMPFLLLRLSHYNAAMITCQRLVVLT